MSGVKIGTILVAVLYVATAGNAQAITESQANQKCSDWQKAGAQGTPPRFETEVQGGKVNCQCEGATCAAKTYTDASGDTKSIQDAMGFFQQAMGMLQSFLGKGGSGSDGSGAETGLPTGNQGTLPSIPSPANFTTGGTQQPSATTGISPTGTDSATKAIESAATEPSPGFLNAVSKGFSDITDKISQVTVGITDKTKSGPTVKAEDAKTDDVVRPTDGGGVQVGEKEKKESTGVSGFYGANTFGPNADASLVSRVCESRPWAGGLIARFIAPTFFDKLCEKTGYHVGPYDPATQVPVNATEMVLDAKARAAAEEELAMREALPKGIRCAPAIIRQGASAMLEFSCGTGERLLRAVGFRAGINDSKVTVRPTQNSTYRIMCSNNFEASCDVRVVNPRIALWSDPQTVRLGSRAVIRWNTQDVENGSCSITGDSFLQKSERGGASTVPITGPTTFTATCTALDGEPITENLTVDLAL